MQFQKDGNEVPEDGHFFGKYKKTASATDLIRFLIRIGMAFDRSIISALVLEYHQRERKEAPHYDAVN